MASPITIINTDSLSIRTAISITTINMVPTVGSPPPNSIPDTPIYIQLDTGPFSIPPAVILSNSYTYSSF